MQENTAIKTPNAQEQSFDLKAEQRITALWALSEAALGGVLHAFRVPFTGLFIGASAVIFITLIASFTRSREAIIKATVMVMIIKALVSPHTPVNAHMAVAFQGLLGAFLFGFIPSQRIAAFILGTVSLLQSALQKLLVLTIVFGMNLWESIDLFGEYVLKQMPVINTVAGSLDISLILISVYICTHVLTGMIAGIFAPILTNSMQMDLQTHPERYVLTDKNGRQRFPQKRKRARFQKRLTLSLLFTMALGIFILSYIFPVFEKSSGTAAVIMIIRSVTIMTIWYFIIGPFLMKKLHRYLGKKQTRYAGEIYSIMAVFPLLKRIVSGSWRSTSVYRGVNRWTMLIKIILYHILTADLSRPSEKSN
ncbi:MAG: hypothetical protein GF313_00460 [Caldithrix sp.]|nr:hypothetical protein [Caldithrix sp.]